MVIINTANKLLSDLGYNIIIKYKGVAFFLKERKKMVLEFSGMPLISKFLILKVFGASYKQSLRKEKSKPLP